MTIDLAAWESRKANIRLSNGKVILGVEPVRSDNQTYPWKISPGNSLQLYTNSGKYFYYRASDQDIAAIEEYIPASTVDIACYEGKQVLLHLRGGKKLFSAVKRNTPQYTDSLGYPWWVDGVGSLTSAGQYYINGQESLHDILAIEECIPAPDPAPARERPSREYIAESLKHLETSVLLLQRGIEDLRKQLEA